MRERVVADLVPAVDELAAGSPPPRLAVASPEREERPARSVPLERLGDRQLSIATGPSSK